MKIKLKIINLLTLFPLMATAETVPSSEAMTPSGVEIASSAGEQRADKVTDQFRVRAQLKTRHSTVISGEMGGRISQLKIREGERFSRGQTLVEFNCTVEQAQLNKAKAVFDKKTKVYEVNQRMAELKAINTGEVSAAKAEAEEVKANVNVAQAVVDRCSIQAPFSGKVVELMARPYQSVHPGDPLLEIIDDNNLEVEFTVPVDAASQLKPGKHFRVALDEMGKAYNAEVVRIDEAVDTVNQAVKVYGHITDKSDDLLPGMSGAVEMMEGMQ